MVSYLQRLRYLIFTLSVERGRAISEDRSFQTKFNCEIYKLEALQSYMILFASHTNHLSRLRESFFIRGSFDQFEGNFLLLRIKQKTYRFVLLKYLSDTYCNAR